MKRTISFNENTQRSQIRIAALAEISIGSSLAWLAVSRQEQASFVLISPLRAGRTGGMVRERLSRSPAI
jgi:hypothetical protein